MTTSRFENLRSLNRTRVPEPERTRLRLQRNEKPDNWPDDLLDRMFTSIPKDLLQRYPDAGPFYKKLAAFLGIEEDRLLLTSGIDEPIKSLIALNCDAGDTVVFTPGYAMYEVYARIFNVESAPIPYDPETFTTPADVIAQIPAGAKILFLPNPSQPVENCFDLDQLAEIAAWCDANGILFVIDEAYHFFGAPSAQPLIEQFDSLLIMRTFSKAFGAASIRLGYVLGGKTTLAPLAAFRLAHEANALSLHAGSVLLDCFDSHVLPSIEAICRGRDWLRDQCRNNGLNAWGRVSNNVLIEIGDAAKTKNVVEALGQDSVFVKGAFPPPLDRHILVTCGPEDMMQTFYQFLQNTMDANQ